MEIRVLRNFLAVAHEQNITNAAESLHLSQSALSRQMLELEQELGTKLFVRTNRDTQLTAEGLRFRNRAQSIIDMADKTITEFQRREIDIFGNISIGAEETSAVDILSEAINQLQQKYPNISYTIVSDSSEAAAEHLDKDIIDFALMFEPFDASKYDYIPLHKKERLGILMKPEDPYAKCDSISTEQLKEMTLIVFQRYLNPRFQKKLNVSRKELTIKGSYNLISNATFLVRSGFANALCVEGGIGHYEKLGLVFRPITPEINYDVVLAWRKYRIHAKPDEVFLDEIRAQISSGTDRC